MSECRARLSPPNSCLLTARGKSIHARRRSWPWDAIWKNVAAHGITLTVANLPDVKRGFVLLPRRWVVERDVG